MVNVIAFIRNTWVYGLVPVAAMIGYQLDRWNDSRMNLYRNKSQLFRSEENPNEDK